MHPAMLDIGDERWRRRFTCAFRQTTLDHPRHWLAVVIEQQEREGDLINAPPILREIGCNQEILTTVPVEVRLPDVRESNAATNCYYCRPMPSIVVPTRKAQRTISVAGHLNLAEFDRVA
jgi:hypothetical protein